MIVTVSPPVGTGEPSEVRELLSVPGTGRARLEEGKQQQSGES